MERNILRSRIIWPLAFLALVLLFVPVAQAAPNKRHHQQKNALAFDAFRLGSVTPHTLIKEVAGSRNADFAKFVTTQFGAEILSNMTLDEATALVNESSGPVINILNNSTMRMCLSAVFSSLAGPKDVVSAIYPLTGKLDKSLPVPGGSIFQYDTSKSGLGKHNAKLFPRWDCDERCNKCGYEKSHLSNSPAVHTLYEYMTDPADPEGQLWENFSNVDGLSANYHRAVPGCPSRSSYVTAEQLKATCPASNTWHHKGVYGCISDCKLTKSDTHCCKGGMVNREICQPSSMFNKQMSPDGYTWAYDDADNFDHCGNARVRNIAFSPITPAGEDVTGIPAPLSDQAKRRIPAAIQQDGLMHSLDGLIGAPTSNTE